MKTTLSQLFTITAIIALTFSCKNEKKTETETTANEATQEEAQQETNKVNEEALTYVVDTSNSKIEWVGKKPTEKHTGTIQIGRGTLSATESGIKTGVFDIDMTSITVTDLTGKEKTGLEGHLKGEGEGKEDHFFNVAKFPTATFDITSINEKEGKTFIEGDLTIKGIKKAISFPATTSITPNSLKLTSDVFTINRTEWRVNYGSKSVFENLGDKFISDDIEIKISIAANPNS